MVKGYLRKNGEAGIRNKILVLYTVNCSAHMAFQIGKRLKGLGIDADVTGNESCYDNQAMVDQLLRLSVHPNVGAVVVAAHGCEFIQGEKIADFARKNGRPAAVVYGQKLGTGKGIERGVELGQRFAGELDHSCELMNGFAGMTIGFTSAASDGTIARLHPAMEAACSDLLVRGARILMPSRFLKGMGTEGIGAETSTDAWVTGKEFMRKHAAGILKAGELPVSAGIWFSDPFPDLEPDREALDGLGGGIAGELTFFAGNGAVLNVVAAGSGVPASGIAAPALMVTANEETYLRMKEDVDAFIRPREDGKARLLELLEAAAGTVRTKAELNGRCRGLLFQNMQSKGGRRDDCLEGR